MAKKRVKGTTDMVEGAAADAIARTLCGQRYGQLEIQVPDARVVRIVRTQKSCSDDECMSRI